MDTTRDAEATMDPTCTRVRRQIALGEQIAWETGVERVTCVEAAHYLLPYEETAQEGDDYTAFARQGLHAYVPEMERLEREAVRGWDDATFARVILRLCTIGPRRAKDVERLFAHRTGASRRPTTPSTDGVRFEAWAE